jgi:hypothetical protein
MSRSDSVQGSKNRAPAAARVTWSLRGRYAARSQDLKPST